MPVFIDQTGQSITLDQYPERIISLVPSQTELLADLGLEESVTGITRFCVHPDSWFRSKTRVGGTKQLKMDVIHQLQPDLVIANKEENVKEQIEELQQHYPVWISDINNLEDACKMIQQIGLITNKEPGAHEIISQIKERFSRPDSYRVPTPYSRLTAVYLIWQNPYMTVGHDTFIHHMMELAGFENMCKHKTRYPELSLAELKTLQPEVLLLSSEPFPFKQKHADELAMQLPNTQIILVDGEMFSWYGSRLLGAPGYFKQLKKQIIDNS